MISYWYWTGPGRVTARPYSTIKVGSNRLTLCRLSPTRGLLPLYTFIDQLATANTSSNWLYLSHQTRKLYIAFCLPENQLTDVPPLALLYFQTLGLVSYKKGLSIKETSKTFFKIPKTCLYLREKKRIRRTEFQKLGIYLYWMTGSQWTSAKIWYRKLNLEPVALEYLFTC